MYDQCTLDFEQQATGTRINNSRILVKCRCANCGSEYRKRSSEEHREWCSVSCRRSLLGYTRACEWCGSLFTAVDGLKQAHCSISCSANRRAWGSLEKKNEAIEKIDRMASALVPAKAIAKALKVSYALVSERIKNTYGSVSPCWTAAIKMHKDGMIEEQIAEKLGLHVSTIINGLSRHLSSYTCGYVNNSSKSKAAADSKYKEKRAITAMYLMEYRKTKNCRLAANALGVHHEKFRTVIMGTHAYKRIRRAMVKYNWTSRRKGWRRISSKYNSEKHFCSELYNVIRGAFCNVNREVVTGETTKTDIVVCISDECSAVIECKWDVKITNLHKGAGQAAIAVKKIGARCGIVCWPSDVNVTQEAINDLSILGIAGMPEHEVLPYLSSLSGSHQ